MSYKHRTNALQCCFPGSLRTLINPQVKAELVSYKDSGEKRGRFDCILPFVSVNLTLMETTKFLVQETVPLSLSKEETEPPGLYKYTYILVIQHL